MRKPIAAVAVAACLAGSPCAAADLTPLEARWLRGAWPVVAFARDEGIPLDVVVQPQPTPGAAPLALGFVDGRCKLVLSMRGNDEARAALAQIEPDLVDAAIELMAAHELGHCRRYLDGRWLSLPAGFIAVEPAGLDAGLREAYLRMRAVRREEGYADLVGLAWVRARHPARFAQLFAWLIAERQRERVPGSHHDTLAWIEDADDDAAVPTVWSLRSIFATAAARWQAILAAEE